VISLTGQSRHVQRTPERFERADVIAEDHEEQLRAEPLARLLHRRRGEDRASHLRHFDEQDARRAARGPRERHVPQPH
jgi:hypothetical protein